MTGTAIFSRRSVLAAGGLAGFQLSSQTAAPKAPDRPPALAPALVKEFVMAGHGDLEKTQKMVEATPSLVYATWDWGGGDFETALGGASHMGRRDIAVMLVERGARLDLFAAAMLGKLDIVKASLASFPKAHLTLGPHKIPLIAHARKGGPEAAQVASFLESLVG